MVDVMQIPPPLLYLRPIRARAHECPGAHKGPAYKGPMAHGGPQGPRWGHEGPAGPQGLGGAHAAYKLPPNLMQSNCAYLAPILVFDERQTLIGSVPRESKRVPNHAAFLQHSGDELDDALDDEFCVCLLLIVFGL